MLHFISIETDKDRKVSLAFSDQKLKHSWISRKLWLVGGLYHNAIIKFDKKNAQKLIDFLQENIIDK